MSEPRCSVFGEKSVVAVAKSAFVRRYAGRDLARGEAQWRYAPESHRALWLEDAAVDLAAAEAALDREGLVERLARDLADEFDYGGVFTAAWGMDDSEVYDPAYWRGIAARRIAALFPTEGEADQ